MSALTDMPELPCDLEYVRLRCVQEDDCWLWAGSKKHDSLPIIFFRRKDAEGEKRDFCLYVRHLVLWIVKGMRPKVGKYQVTVTTCENSLCVNPDHIAIVTRKTLNKGAVRSIATTIKMAQARRKGSKLSDDDVREIRASDGTTKEIADRYGISQQYVSMIRANKWRKEYANPFMGLGASNDSSRRRAA